MERKTKKKKKRQSQKYKKNCSVKNILNFVENLSSWKRKKEARNKLDEKKKLERKKKLKYKKIVL